MLEIQYPWLLLLLPLPLLIQRWLKPRAAPIQALRVPFLQRLAVAAGIRPQRQLVQRRLPLQQLLMAVFWCAVVLALVRPVWLGAPLTEQQPTRDLMLAVDISGSMVTEDMRPSSGGRISRIDALKQLLGEFAARRQGDRFGLILFGSAPYLQVPFSRDLALFERLLQESQVPMAGPKTMLGDAIGLALKHFKSSDSDQKLLLLFTDGNDSGSRVAPFDAAAFARDNNIRIHTIAIGHPDTPGEVALDLALLQQLADLTGGQLHQATSHQRLEQLLQQLDRLEPSQLQSHSWRPRQALYHWPLLAALLLALLIHLWLAWTHRGGRYGTD